MLCSTAAVSLTDRPADTPADKAAEFERLLRTKLEPELARVAARLAAADSERMAWLALEHELAAQCTGRTDLHTDVGCGIYVRVRVDADASPLLVDFGLGWFVEFDSPRAALPVVRQRHADALAEWRLLRDRHALVDKHARAMRFALRHLRGLVH